MSKREALLSALAQLRVAHPALPQLRDFQVSPGPFHAVCIQLITMSSVGHTPVLPFIHDEKDKCKGFKLLYKKIQRHLSNGSDIDEIFQTSKRDFVVFLFLDTFHISRRRKNQDFFLEFCFPKINSWILWSTFFRFFVKVGKKAKYGIRKVSKGFCCSPCF